MQCIAQAGLNSSHFTSTPSNTESILASKLTFKQTIFDNSPFPNKESVTRDHSVMMQPKVQWHSALFCKIEDQISKNLPIQFKFRLGNQDYVDYLEGKSRGGLSFLNDNN